ncbi:hypothetical protein D3C75_818430 [compost metagenome]
MNDACLQCRVWKYGAESFWHAFKAIGHSNQHVFDAACLEVVENLHPKFGALGSFDPNAENIACSVRQNPQGQVDRLVANQPLFADFDP